MGQGQDLCKDFMVSGQTAPELSTEIKYLDKHCKMSTTPPPLFCRWKVSKCKKHWQTSTFKHIYIADPLTLIKLAETKYIMPRYLYTITCSVPQLPDMSGVIQPFCTDIIMTPDMSGTCGLCYVINLI